MERKRVGTAGIASMGYNAQQAVLEIEFRTDGQVWQYYEVPEDIWYEFRNTVSTDAFYYRHISGKYMERRICSTKQRNSR